MRGRKARRPLSKLTLGKQILHTISGIPTYIGYEVAVCVHGQPDLRMAEDVHHYPGRYALHQKQRRTRMAQIMKATLLKTGALQEAMESFGDRRSIQRLPLWRRED